MAFRCIFCAGVLQEEEGNDQLSCPGCRAVFRAERDREGCVVGVKVVGCGAEDCCREREEGS